MIGQTLDHYRILEKIGEGGMGVVYRAHDERLDRDVALKVLPAGTLADDTASKRLRREALALARLNHPHIETVHDFDTEDAVDFLVMEHVPGPTLADRLMSGRAGRSRRSLRLGHQLATALEEAHGLGVVHRDLKPGNIKVTPKGQVKVLDFGLAALLRPAAESRRRRGRHERRGTARHGAVHGTGAVAGPARRCAERHLRGRGRALRDGDRPAAVPGAGDDGRDRRHSTRGAASADAHPARAVAAARGHRPQVPGEGPGEPLPVGKGTGCGSAPAGCAEHPARGDGVGARPEETLAGGGSAGPGQPASPCSSSSAPSSR